MASMAHGALHHGEQHGPGRIAGLKEPGEGVGDQSILTQAVIEWLVRDVVQNGYGCREPFCQRAQEDLFLGVRVAPRDVH